MYEVPASQLPATLPTPSTSSPVPAQIIFPPSANNITFQLAPNSNNNNRAVNGVVHNLEAEGGLRVADGTSEELLKVRDHSVVSYDF